MKKISLSPYELKHSFSGQVRKGYLLRLQTPEFAIGYGDIFPWPEFGDPCVKEIPKRLKEGVLSPLLEKSLFLAAKDGVARREKVSLLQGEVLENHFLVEDLSQVTKEILVKAQESGFNRFKVKVCRNGDELQKLYKIAQDLSSDSYLRLDCNTQGKASFFKNLAVIKNKIEFIEDPYERADQWKLDFPLAYDQPGFLRGDVNVKWQVFKPAKQFLQEAHAENIVCTSYMDHPVGIAHGFSEALSLGEQKTDYGFLSQNIYESTEFHQQMIVEGKKLSFVEGHGIGFDSLLEKQDWIDL